MPHAALKLVGGVNTNETPTLNENSGISESNLIRFFYDPGGNSLVQKLGGWSRFNSLPAPAIVRALWAWEDLNLNAHLAVGTETITATGSAQLAVITGSNIDDITPTSLEDNPVPLATSVAGNPSIQITDATVPGITNFNSVYIATQIAIGGLVLFGLYQCDPDGFLAADAYTVFARDKLGNLLPASSGSSSPVVAQFTTVMDAITVTVTLPNYTYAVGDTFPVLTPTTVGGVNFFGNYVVQTQVDINSFTILANVPATTSASGFMNGGNARYLYSFGQGALPGGTGYGVGTYGGGGYGTGTPVVPAVGPAIDAIDWTLDNWGEILIACPDRSQPFQETPFQPVYQWDEGASSATIITAAPPFNDGIFVAMPQRQIVAWGSTQTGIPDPLLIRWCDISNFNSWIGTVTNQAGSYRIPKGSKIVSCSQGPQQAVIWTDIDVWSMQYIGQPYVYGFNEIGTGCGLIGRKAAGSLGGIYYWMGSSYQMFTLSGNGVQVLPCDVWDVVYQNLDKNNLQKIRFAANSRFGEVTWYYPSILGGTGEVDSYVKYNTYLGKWDVGSLGRSAWVDQSVLGPPIGADPQTKLLQQHETSNDADGAAMLSSFRTGDYAIEEGDVKAFIDWVWPDMKWGQFSQAKNATVQITFYVKDYPSDTPKIYGPYSVSEATKYFYTRLRARLVSVKISSSDLGSFWRTGLIRYRYAVDGKV